MFKVVPFHYSHVAPLLEETHNADIKWWQNQRFKYAKRLGRNSKSFTAMWNDEPLACAFMVDIWDGRGYLICVLSEKIKDHSVVVFRGIQNFLKSQPYRRLEMDVPVNFEIGHRRAKMLGFELVTACARKYLPNGSDAAIYAWVRE